MYHFLNVNVTKHKALRKKFRDTVSCFMINHVIKIFRDTNIAFDHYISKHGTEPCLMVFARVSEVLPDQQEIRSEGSKKEKNSVKLCWEIRWKESDKIARPGYSVASKRATKILFWLSKMTSYRIIIDLCINKGEDSKDGDLQFVTLQKHARL
jgi:hypothetical protein